MSSLDNQEDSSGSVLDDVKPGELRKKGDASDKELLDERIAAKVCTGCAQPNSVFAGDPDDPGGYQCRTCYEKGEQ